MTTSQTIDGVPLMPCPFCGKEPRYVPADYVDSHGNPWPFAECNPCNVGAPVEFWNERAAPPQGDPVAWVECSPAWLEAGGDCATAPRLCVGREGISHLHPAHAKQPAPVAVVLPERNKASKNLDLEQCGWVDGWNACLDEVTRLNTK